MHCDPSLEPSRRDGSNEGSQRMFSLRNKENISELSVTPCYRNSTYMNYMMKMVLTTHLQDIEGLSDTPGMSTTSPSFSQVAKVPESMKKYNYDRFSFIFQDYSSFSFSVIFFSS